MLTGNATITDPHDVREYLALYARLERLVVRGEELSTTRRGSGRAWSSFSWPKISSTDSSGTARTSTSSRSPKEHQRRTLEGMCRNRLLFNSYSPPRAPRTTIVPACTAMSIRVPASQPGTSNNMLHVNRPLWSSTVVA
ncbi:hypothetical protein GCM10010492_70020 [Saccharothrix mutabilis subsp. mutabilis]|uniref:Uncharacterized protein n=1 Tax=Saccharothrix mutabilis subsp. mutabilis TaxID=66855 RepID=A0ABP3EED3_9PSEU